MTEIAWAILRQNDRFLLAQRSFDDLAGGTWTFPGGKVDQSDKNIIETVNRELGEEVGLNGLRFRKLLNIHIDRYLTYIFICDKWRGELKLSCNDIIGAGWFTCAEMYALGHSLSPFVSRNLLYLSYLIQHYDSHPNEWTEQWRECDGHG